MTKPPEDRDNEPEPIDPAHLPAVLEGLAQVRAKQFASDEEVAAAFRLFAFAAP
jgi:hypothetical protein